MKKRESKLLSTLLVLCMVLSLLPGTVLAASPDFQISSEGWLNRYNGPGGAVTIPDGVIRIATYAFGGCSSVTSVTIPDSVTSIGGQAFYGCTSLTSVTIPVGVTEIKINSFLHCDSLRDVYYGGSESQWNQISFSGGNDALLDANIHYADGSTSDTPTPSFKIELSGQKLTVNGKSIDCEKYNIDGYNYFKLRDLACLLNGTGSQFEVGYDAAANAATVATGAPYTGDMALTPGVDNSASAQPSAQKIIIDGKEQELTAYNIGGYNFFQLRELGDLLNFEVGYDEASKAVTVTSVEK